MWSLGYHQCRWGYWNETDLQTVVAELDAHDFPIDAIGLIFNILIMINFLHGTQKILVFH